MYCVKQTRAKVPVSHAASSSHMELGVIYRSHGPGPLAIGALGVCIGMWDTCRTPLDPLIWGGTEGCPTLQGSWDVCLHPVPGLSPLCPQWGGLHPSTHDRPLPQLAGYPLCPPVCGPGGAASLWGMAEDSLCWGSCVSAGGHLLPDRHAWEIIYLVSYDFVFPCVNIWEAQLMFCAQPRQLQPSA